MKKMILIERSKFALLVRSHMKASNMLLVLQHVCRERRISLSMTQEEVCQLIRLDPDFVEKYKRRGKLCPVEDQDGKQYYNVLDFINLKDMQESSIRQWNRQCRIRRLRLIGNNQSNSTRLPNKF